MNTDAAARARLIRAIAETVLAHADELTDLDQAIGDGDHGLNMKRGFETVLAESATLAEQPLPAMLTGIGKTLVMRVGGASGPLYGTLFLTLGKTLPAEPTAAEAGAALAAAVDAVKARGKSEAGQKTMLDVLVPVLDDLKAGGAGLPARLAMVAHAAAEATVPMRAVRGRASFLGERSIGHMDPGARSSALMVDAVVAWLEEQA
ncbi:dihydroxyacetone kinase subunit DhaL [Azospirillum sp. TSO22-1]|uniref:dihydroxyacetone kinase subunit DhaL n=1 Tax=Azospirillum sp. TSO22-1 TaxID=716789 RepID=UPI000D609ECA|nr:dihydroxyacetone kinase subunit DhaL [Azospirillum sp. TSO22-1]PWC38144.1 dihydroxyacetone kinase [Azospirillum sp. TSO22-1]